MRSIVLGLLSAISLLAWPIAPKAEEFALVDGQTTVGELRYTTAIAKDTLPDIARRYDLGYTELISANPDVDPWLPGDDTLIVLPTFFVLPDVPRKGIVINLVRQRLFYFPPNGKSVITFPIGVGIEGRSTPLGTTRIKAKKERPTWYPPKSILSEEPELPSVVPPGPDNPMGGFALYLAWPTYAIHGTNKPYGIGRNVSHGCIRLYPEDVASLFQAVRVGTSVRVIDEEIQIAWVGDDLYLAVFPNKQQTDEIDIGHPLVPAYPDGLQEKVMQAAGDQQRRVVWPLVEKIGRERTAIPTLITLPALPLSITD